MKTSSALLPRHWIKTSLAIGLALTLSACSDTSDTVAPTDSVVMSQAVSIGSGNSKGVLRSGTMPTGNGTPGIIGSNIVEARAGESALIDVSFDTAMTTLYAKIGNAPQYFQIDLSAAVDGKALSIGKAGLTYRVAIALPSYINAGSFTLSLSGSNGNLTTGASTVQVNVKSATIPAPTPAPTAAPTTAPTTAPTPAPTSSTQPTATPTAAPTPVPTAAPTTTPAPTAAPTATPGSGSNAKACFNPTLFTAGTVLDEVVRTTDGDSGIVLTTTSNIKVTGTKTFNGQQAIESVYNSQARSTTNPEFNSDVVNSLQYSQISGTTSNFLGTHVTATSNGFAIDTTVTLEPGRQQRFDLNPGQSFDQTYDTYTEIAAAGFSQGKTLTTTTTTKITYLGQESVTVPAGTFTACKFFDENTSTTSLTGAPSSATQTDTTTWFAVGSGYFLKSTSTSDNGATDESVLVSGKINGTPIQ